MAKKRNRRNIEAKMNAGWRCGISRIERRNAYRAAQQRRHGVKSNGVMAAGGGEKCRRKQACNNRNGEEMKNRKA
jgi:hypothetical protein